MFDPNLLARIFGYMCVALALFFGGFFYPHHSETQIRERIIQLEPKPLTVTLVCPDGDVHKLLVTPTTSLNRVRCHSKRGSSA